MKKLLVILFISIFLNTVFAQGQKASTLSETASIEESIYRRSNENNKRISFIVGLGPSVTLDQVFQIPTVDLSTKSVIIENAQPFKTNISLGIVYTPFLYLTEINGRDEEVNKGLSIATFFNPFSISNAGSTDFFSMVDVGFGIGYKFQGSFMILGTFEFLNARQPKDWFIKAYQNNNKSYLVDNAPQVTFDLSDNNIFRNKIVPTLGIKFCYTFDVINSYRDLTKKGES